MIVDYMFTFNILRVCVQQ